MSWARELWQGWFQTGSEEHFHNPLLEPLPCWRALPMLPQCEILEYLDPVALNNIRRVARYERYLVEDRHGFFMVVPARNWNLLQGKGKLVCDSMVKTLVTGMSGKVIRGLEMTEMPPFPTELLESCIFFPRFLVYLKLTYFDVDLIYRFLTLFQNLRSFEYSTSLYRPAPNAIQSLLQFRALFQPSKIPRANLTFAEFITQGLPASTSLHLPNLTTLTLCLQQTSDSFHHSDWANVFYLLLAITPVNLKSFQFSLKPDPFLLDETVAMIILCVLAEFLGKTGNLQKFGFQSSANVTRVHRFPFFSGLDFLRALPVLRPLVDRFSSPELQNIFRDAEGRAFPTSGVRTTAQNFVGRIASAMGNLKELRLKLGKNSAEFAIFRVFLEKVPALERLELNEKYDALHLLLHPVIVPVVTGNRTLRINSFGTLQKVEIKASQPISMFRLQSLLERLPRLMELRLRQFRQLQNSQGTDRNWTNRLPDITVRIDDPSQKSMFERLTVLQLEGFRIFRSEVAKVKICRNLEQLCLEIPIDHLHNSFGIESKDLLEIVASLRKLERVTVSGIQFPGRGNLKDLVARRHQWALEMVGKLQLPEKIFSILA